MRKNLDDLIGQSFGNLSVIGRAENTKQGKRRWICRCACGKVKEKPVTSFDLKSGKVKSCGCLYFSSNKNRTKTHGMTNSRIYRIWLAMRSRCLYSKNIEYKNYGGRGITVCEKWKNSFQAFYDWAMSNGYEEHLTIDRIDSNGNYEPSNCRWATMKEQQNNRRNNRIVNYKNKKYKPAELAVILNTSVETLLWRINHGWEEDELAIAPSFCNKIIRSKKT